VFLFTFKPIKRRKKERQRKSRRVLHID